MMGGVILLPIVGHLIDKSWNGAIENGIKIYSTDDFYCGFTSVIAFLLFAFILATLIKDKKPRQP
jgi:hypothetical protein